MSRIVKANNDDRGSAAVEMVLLAPVLMLVTLFIVFLGRSGGALEQVRHAAGVAARSASIAERNSMQGVAAAAAADDLRANGVNCASVSTTAALSTVQRLSTVTVTVTCTINTDGLGALGVGQRSVSASSTEVVDYYLGGDQ